MTKSSSTWLDIDQSGVASRPSGRKTDLIGSLRCTLKCSVRLSRPERRRRQPDRLWAGPSYAWRKEESSAMTQENLKFIGTMLAAAFFGGGLASAVFSDRVSAQAAPTVVTTQQVNLVNRAGRIR